ncbi:hypothetical protein F2Q69_00010015 [Brassica cretica]|uniref:Uncharacterized protein n=1 Tax=Brassica cretica TaxID=69181 RepID=A0A8S9NVE7_BRACR|nr:hypothetical protein F2Q69_00010015 [Brassica cretica]
MEVTELSEICGRISQKRRDCLRKRHRKQPRERDAQAWAGPQTFANIEYRMIIDEGLEEPPSCPDLVRKTHTHADGSFIDK